MTLHMQREIDRLKKSILSLSAIVEESVQKAVLAVENLDVELARKVMESDDQIDDLEVDLEEECLKILALHQPVANDLRFIIAVLKINNDLERIGDLAGNIAERTIALAEEKERIVAPSHFPAMVVGVEEMLKKSLDALVNLDLRLAAQVCRMDDQIDKLPSTQNLEVHQVEKFTGRSLTHKGHVNKGNIDFAMAAHPGLQSFGVTKHMHVNRLVQLFRQVFAQSFHVLCVAGKTFTALDTPDSQTCICTGRGKQQER